MHRSIGVAVLVGVMAAMGPFAKVADAKLPTDARSRGAVERARALLTGESARVFADGDHDFEPRDVVIDPDGSAHVRFDRLYQRLRVIAGDLVVHTDPSGRFAGVSQTLVRRIDVKVAAVLGDDDAIAVARREQRDVPSETRPSSELVVYARGEKARLAYEVVVEGFQPGSVPSRLHVIVDATTGGVLDRWEGIPTAGAPGSGKGLYVGAVSLTTSAVNGGFTLVDPSRGNMATATMSYQQYGSPLLLLDADNAWGSGATTDPATVAVDAQYGAAVTWDYFRNVHGRNGIADDGIGSASLVHFGRRFDNAYWDDGCFCMTFGNGDGVTTGPLVALDVAAHEMSHGVTSHTANLIYSGESGGLNEATSDIFGTLVEFSANNAADAGDWLIGEKVMKRQKAMRYLYKPSLDGTSADCWSPRLGWADVHDSSGVGNHFFYLLSEGSSPTGGQVSPTCNRSAVTGIGRDGAGKIWYRALTTYFTSATTYAGARRGTIQAAKDLYGASSTQASAVAKAWSAVGVN